MKCTSWTASFWSGKAWTRFPPHITESHAYLHFLTANTGRSTSLLRHKPAQSPQTNKNMQSYELSCPHTHNDSTDGRNRIKYSQHSLSLYQQPFNFSSTILLRLFWTMRAHFHPAQGVCVLTPHSAGTGAPWANWSQVRWMAEAENSSLSLSRAAFCCFSSFLRSPWSQPNASLHWGAAWLQQGWPRAAARMVPLATASFPPSLPATKKQRQEWGRHIHHKWKSF